MSRLSTKHRRAARKRRRRVSAVVRGRALWPGRTLTYDEALAASLATAGMAGICTPARRWFSLEAPEFDRGSCVT